MSRPRWSVPSRKRGSPRAAQRGGLSLYVRCWAVGSNGASASAKTATRTTVRTTRRGTAIFRCLRRNAKSHSPAPAITLSNEDPLLALTSAAFRCVSLQGCWQDHRIDPRSEGDTAVDTVQEELLPEIQPGGIVVQNLGCLEIQLTPGALVDRITSCLHQLVEVSVLLATRPVRARKSFRVQQSPYDPIGVEKRLFRGFAKPIAQGAAPTDFGFNPSIPDYPYDPEKAKKLLANAGYPKGFSVVVQSSNGYILGDTLVVEAVVEMLKKIGVDAQPRVLEIARRAEMLGKRQVTGLVLANPGSTLFDTDGIVWRLLHPEALAGSYWPRGQKDTDFYKLMETARYTIDENARRELYFKAAEILHDDPPWLYLWQEFFLYGVNCRVAFAARVDTMILPASLEADASKRGGGQCQ